MSRVFRPFSQGRRVAILVAGLVFLSAPTVVMAEDDPGAPVTVDDSFDISARSPRGRYPFNRTVDVLANDSDPDGDPLTVCRYTVPDGAALDVVPSGTNSLDIYPTANKTASYDITYYACDGVHETPGTVTIHVIRLEPIHAEVLAQPGRVTFTNPSSRPLGVDYGKVGTGSRSRRISVLDGRLDYLAPGESATVRVSRDTIAWYGYAGDGTFGGRGVLTDIELPDRAAQDAPVTAHDTYEIFGRGPKSYDDRTTRRLVANDTDPNGDPLEVCQMRTLENGPVSLLPARTYSDGPDGAFVVLSAENRTGSYDFRYHACDGDYRTPGTLTINVTRVKPVRAAALRRPGRMELTNPSALTMRVIYGEVGGDDSFFGVRDGVVERLAPGASIRVRVRRAQIAYRAYSRSPEGVPGGHGVLSGIALP